MYPRLLFHWKLHSDLSPSWDLEGNHSNSEKKPSAHRAFRRNKQVPSNSARPSSQPSLCPLEYTHRNRNLTGGKGRNQPADPSKQWSVPQSQPLGSLQPALKNAVVTAPQQPWEMNFKQRKTNVNRRKSTSPPPLQWRTGKAERSVCARNAALFALNRADQRASRCSGQPGHPAPGTAVLMPHTFTRSGIGNAKMKFNKNACDSFKF